MQIMLKKIAFYVFTFFIVSVVFVTPTYAANATTIQDSNNSAIVDPGGGGGGSVANSENGCETGELCSDLRGELENQVGFNPNIGDFITGLINFIIVLGALASLMYLIWGAVDWITSGGDQQKYSSAKNKITAAIFGLVLLASVWAAWQLVLHFLGLQSLFNIT